MIKNINKKMLAYSAVASAFLAGTTEAEAQIGFTDVDPDTTLAATAGSSVTFDIDFNGDGTAEFFGLQLNSAPTFVAAQFSQSNNLDVMGTAGAYYAYPTVLAAGDSIGAMAAFVADTKAALRSSYGGNFYGNFDGLSGFVGCRLDIAGGTHYGWVEAEASSDATELTIKGYAYEMTPGVSIAAGDTSSATVNVVRLEDVDATLGQVQPNPVTDGAQLPITLGEAADVQLDVVNLVGQTMERRNVALAAGEHFLEFSFSDYPAGQYFVRLRVGNKLITRKVTVQ